MEITKRERPCAVATRLVNTLPAIATRVATESVGRGAPPKARGPPRKSTVGDTRPSETSTERLFCDATPRTMCATDRGYTRPVGAPAYGRPPARLPPTGGDSTASGGDKRQVQTASVARSSVGQFAVGARRRGRVVALIVRLLGRLNDSGIWYKRSICPLLYVYVY